ncbi:MAG: hypothetical protein HKO59_13095 [Phycisphaerales bacterium]|nr:hypothetical protein [Phycisphaerae bacterium]NNF41510.1 hypothetical protein [Phycisphaerales bacterium]NNM26899.1 hypothetical protein [Phycisphaerales bacterium]
MPDRPTPDDDTAVLVNVATDWQAELIAEALRARDINAEAAGALTAGFRAEAPGLVRVIVPARQLAEARAKLAEVQRDASDIDWSQVDVGKAE